MIEVHKVRSPQYRTVPHANPACLLCGLHVLPSYSSEYLVTLDGAHLVHPRKDDKDLAVERCRIGHECEKRVPVVKSHLLRH